VICRFHRLLSAKKGKVNATRTQEGKYLAKQGGGKEYNIFKGPQGGGGKFQNKGESNRSKRTSLQSESNDNHQHRNGPGKSTASWGSSYPLKQCADLTFGLGKMGEQNTHTSSVVGDYSYKNKMQGDQMNEEFIQRRVVGWDEEIKPWQRKKDNRQRQTYVKLKGAVRRRVRRGRKN